MYKKLTNEGWEQYINKFYEDSHEISIKDYCIKHNLNKGQFYYHKRRLKEINEPVFHAIKIESKEDHNKEIVTATSEIEIKIGNSTISIPVSETTLITAIIKELVLTC